MARKKRYGITMETPATAIEKVYNTAIYARLSSEDETDLKTGSLDNQIYLIRDYINGQPCLKEILVFSDNGETGTNFNRPGFNAMMDEVRAGKIDCIVVKDLSRFGRNYIETGEYLEKIFPFMGIRFIAINDGYDSEKDNSADLLVVSLKNLINDFYAKDISKKIASSFRTMQKNGDFIGCYAPYGYRKSDENCHKLVVDDETAPIVRSIFRWKANGVGTTAIAERLNNIGIPTPIERFLKNGKVKKTGRLKWYIWTASSVTQITKNMMYLGHMVQGKQRSDLHKTKNIPPSEWIIVESTHEPLVDRELFDMAQITRGGPKKVCQERTKHDHKENYLFKGLLVCPLCGSVLVRHKMGDIYKFYCPVRQVKSKKACQHKSISEAYLSEVLLYSIKMKIEEAGGLAAINMRYDRGGKASSGDNELTKQIEQLKKEIKRVSQLKVSLYESYAEKLLTEDEYVYSKQRYTEQIDNANRNIERLQEEKSKRAESASPKNQWFQALTRFSEGDELSYDIVNALIDRIIVNGKDYIEIIWSFIDEYKPHMDLSACAGREVL